MSACNEGWGYTQRCPIWHEVSDCDQGGAFRVPACHFGLISIEGAEPETCDCGEAIRGRMKRKGILVFVEDKPCPNTECVDGVIDKSSMDQHGNWDVSAWECHICHGTGKVDG